MIARIFRSLGDQHPGIRVLFPEDTSPLNTKLFETLGQIVRALPRLQSLEDLLRDIGAKAGAAGAKPAHYRIVRDELLTTMAKLAGVDWTPELANDWKLVLDGVSGAMMRGAAPRPAAASAAPIEVPLAAAAA
jgi:hemoglobin-like flavoprotein